VNRLDLTALGKGLPEIVGDVRESGAPEKVKGAVEGAKEKHPDTGEAREKAEGVREKVGEKVEAAREKIR
jgi:hypothetical protein